MLLKNDLQLKSDQCVINARSHSGAILFTLVQSEGSRKRKEKGEREGQGKVERRKGERGRVQPKEKVGKKKERLAFFFFLMCLPSPLRSSC